MTQVEQRRRELFESWAITRKHQVNGLPFFVMKNEAGDYLDGTTTYAWEGFSAALDAVVIELPGQIDRGCDCDRCDCGNTGNAESTAGADSHNALLLQAYAAIESTGLGLKVLP